ncbi:MAG: FtsX-like permease family protein [Lachnospiraceae bacterium]|nr:FtsX-like permease family protein [Lachnospiraceae bacterium]
MNDLNVFKRAKRNIKQVYLLITPVVLLSMVLFASFVIDLSLKQGVSNLEKRIGSDYILVPKGAKNDAEDIILEGARGIFYFDRSVYDEVKNVEGVKEATEQFFLKSMAADCCSSEVEIIFYNPETDFLIHPWISSEYKKAQDKNCVVTGSFVNVEDNGNIKIFGREYKVAAKMAKTGTSLDSSIYFTFDSLDTVLADASEKGSFITDEQQNGDLISSVFINIEEGYEEGDVLNRIKTSVSTDYDLVFSKELSRQFSDNLSNIYEVLHIINIFAIMFFVAIDFCVNCIVVNSQKTEIALYRIMGIDKKSIIKILFEDALLTSILGGTGGCLLSALFTVPFGDYIGNMLEMPYLGPDFLRVTLFIVLVTLLTVVIGILGSLYPIIVVCVLDPYTALRKEGE